jgi:hypothetical protein
VTPLLKTLGGLVVIGVTLLQSERQKDLDYVLGNAFNTACILFHVSTWHDHQIAQTLDIADGNLSLLLESSSDSSRHDGCDG